MFRLRGLYWMKNFIFFLSSQFRRSISSPSFKICTRAGYVVDTQLQLGPHCVDVDPTAACMVGELWQILGQMILVLVGGRESDSLLRESGACFVAKFSIYCGQAPGILRSDNYFLMYSFNQIGLHILSDFIIIKYRDLTEHQF